MHHHVIMQYHALYHVLQDQKVCQIAHYSQTYLFNDNFVLTTHKMYFTLEGCKFLQFILSDMRENLSYIVMG